jgi:hypothetical protein
MAEGAWRLEIRVSGEAAAGGRHPARAKADKVRIGLRAALPGEVALDGSAATLIVHAFNNEQIEGARRQLDVTLREIGATAKVRVAHRDAGGRWVPTAGPYAAPRVKHAGRDRGRGQKGQFLSRRAKLKWLIGFGVAAVTGASWYAVAPGVASFQIGFVFILPLLVVALVWLHRRLPLRLQWALAIALAIIGAAGYIVFSGSQWWAWSQVAVLPLAALLVGTAIQRNPDALRQRTWYGGMQDGPWGPP